MQNGNQLQQAIVKDGKDENESVLTIETNGALTAEEVVMAAIEKINLKIKNFNHTIQSLEIPNNAVGTIYLGI